MDNLVDIDALLGDLELESGDDQRTKASTEPASQCLGDSASSPIVNGSSHGMKNGSQPIQQNGKSHTNSYMDDLIDISVEPDFAPALSSLQLGHSNRPSLPKTHHQPHDYSSNLGDFGIHSTTVLPPQTSVALAPSKIVSQESSSGPVAESTTRSSNSGFDFFDLTEPARSSMASVLNLPNYPPSMVPDTSSQWHNSSNSSHVDSTNQLSQLKPDVYSSLTNPPSLTSSRPSASADVTSLTEQSSVVPYTDKTVTNSDYGLPLTEDLDFLTNYEHQRSIETPHISGTGNQPAEQYPLQDQSVHPLDCAGSHPVVAQAPSLDQFSADLTSPSSTNSHSQNVSHFIPPSEPGHFEYPGLGHDNQDLANFDIFPHSDMTNGANQSGKDSRVPSMPSMNSSVIVGSSLSSNSQAEQLPSIRSVSASNGLDGNLAPAHDIYTMFSPELPTSNNALLQAETNTSVSQSDDHLGWDCPTPSGSVSYNQQSVMHSSEPNQPVRTNSTDPKTFSVTQQGNGAAVSSDLTSNELASLGYNMERDNHDSQLHLNTPIKTPQPNLITQPTPDIFPDFPVQQQQYNYSNIMMANTKASDAHYSSLPVGDPTQVLNNKPVDLLSYGSLGGLPTEQPGLLNGNVSSTAEQRTDRNVDEEFNSLLAANGYLMSAGTGPSSLLNDTVDSLTLNDSATTASSSPLVAFGSLKKDPNISGSIDSFTKLQYTESQLGAESFTALHNMSVNQAHRNSLLEQNGILPTSEVNDDIGWDIGATTAAVGADDVFADIGLDEPVMGEVSFTPANGSTAVGPINELPPGEVPPVDNPTTPGFVEESSAYFVEPNAEMYAARESLVNDDYGNEPVPTTADLQSMVTQDESAEPDVPESANATDDGQFPDIPPPPYQVTDPALDAQSNIPHPDNSFQNAQMPQQPDFPVDSGEYLDMGATKPLWMPDSETNVCMACETKFSFTKRKHHCRSCGKIFCDHCSNMRSKLQYMDFKEARVCRTCHENIALAAEQQARLFSAQLSSPQPQQPYPGQQYGEQRYADPTMEAAAVGAAIEAGAADGASGMPAGAMAAGAMPAGAAGQTMPAGVLKDTSANRGAANRDTSRSVIFSDGIRPGDENSHLDGSDTTSSSKVRRKSKNRQKTNHRLRETLRNTFLIPENMLPPLLCYDDDSSQYSTVDAEPDELGLIAKLREEADDGRFAFAIHKDLCVEIKIVNMDCCTNKQCWCFTSCGLNSVSQDEVVFVLECLPGENSIPRDVFHLFRMLYQQAAAGRQVTELGYADLSTVAPFHETGFLGSTDNTALLFIRATFQCLKGLCLPNPPYLFAMLIHRLELPWARLFPVRLKLRLGAEFKYYPCPLMSVRGRPPVYGVIGNTIMNLLADFHTYKYSLNKIEGFTVHLMDKVTTISIPKNMYPSVMKVVGASQECVIAFGASFSTQADSHIVCMQNEDSTYTSRTMNIRDQERTVTGASFVVFSGSMKESYGASAKCSIVEDGIMVQITKEALDEFKTKINNMQEYTITCSRSEDSKEPNEQVKIVWIDDYKDYNIGVVSPIDDFPMDGVMSLRVKSFSDLTRDSYTIRWTEVFFVQVDESRLTIDAMEITQFSETVANSTCSALAPFLAQLHQHGMKKVALRVTLGPEQVEYICGSLGCKLKADVMNSLDGELVPVLHSAVSVISGSLLILELIFHILE